MTAPSIEFGNTMVLSFAKFGLGFGLALCRGNGGDRHYHAGKILVGLLALLWFQLLHFNVVILLTQIVFRFCLQVIG